MYQRCPTRANFLHYKQCRNNVCSMLHSAKKDYFSQKFNSIMDNHSKFFKVLDSITGRKQSRHRVPMIKEEHSEITDPYEIANIFNQKFRYLGDTSFSPVPVSEKNS